MDQGMKVLILEDAAFDAELIEYELEKLKVPLSLRLVVTREEFLQALEEFRPSLILADYRLPAFDGLTALALAQENCPETPFIFVSGAMSPELAEAGLAARRGGLDPQKPALPPGGGGGRAFWGASTPRRRRPRNPGPPKRICGPAWSSVPGR